MLDKRLSQWAKIAPSEWSKKKMDGPIPLLRPAGEYADFDTKTRSWSTPTSLRNVDASCEGKITNLYLAGDKEELL